MDRYLRKWLNRGSMQILKRSKSICPSCLKVLDAEIYEDGGIVYIRKECKDHGRFEDVYWSDFEMYSRAEKFGRVGKGLKNPRTKTIRGCPFDCGICPSHKSHTILAIIDVTNRCNMGCPVCFASSNPPFVYEPTIEEIKLILKNLRSNEPVPPPALQLSGGEPTVRDDLPEIIRLAKKEGFHHIEVNTNGLKLSSLEYCKELKEAGASGIYLQFDGVTPEPYIKLRGRDYLKEKLRAIENCRKVGLVVILVPTVVKGVNDNQLGAIIKFAAENSDVVRCVNFQPVSITGRINYSERMQMRITIPECIHKIEEQTGGMIKAEDFYPVPCVAPISRLVGAMKGKSYVEFTTHPHCGMATYIFVKDGKIVPITRYANVERFLGAIEKAYEDFLKGSKLKAKLRMYASFRHIKWWKLSRFVFDILREGSYEALRRLHMRMIMIGMMHFMDRYNFDLERIQRCTIHYGIPDGRIIPFCTYNTIHRPEAEEKFSIPYAEWVRQRRS